MQRTTLLYINGTQHYALNSSGYFPHYQVGNNITFVIMSSMVNAIQQVFASVQAVMFMQIGQLEVQVVITPDTTITGYNGDFASSIYLYLFEK